MDRGDPNQGFCALESPDDLLVVAAGGAAGGFAALVPALAGKSCVDRFCDFVEEILRAEHGVAEVVRRRKRNASAPVADGVLADLLACDGVLSAVGARSRLSHLSSESITRSAPVRLW